MSHVGVCLDILLGFQLSPSFKGISDTNPCLISDFVTTYFGFVARSFRFRNVRHVLSHTSVVVTSADLATRMPKYYGLRDW